MFLIYLFLIKQTCIELREQKRNNLEKRIQTNISNVPYDHPCIAILLRSIKGCVSANFSSPSTCSSISTVPLETKCKGQRKLGGAKDNELFQRLMKDSGALLARFAT